MAVRNATKRKVISRHEAFAPLLYDTLFSLVLIFGLEGFLHVRSNAHLAMYAAMYAMVIQWWLMFKTAEHRIGGDARDASHHIVMNMAYILVLQIALLFARAFDHVGMTFAVMSLLVIDLLWVWIIRDHAMFAPRKRGATAARTMFDAVVRSDLMFGGALLALLLLGSVLDVPTFVGLFAFLVVSFAVVTHRFGILDLQHV